MGMHGNDNLPNTTVSCSFSPTKILSPLDICLLHWLQPTFLVYYCLLSVFNSPCRKFHICHSPTIWDNLLLLVVCSRCWECLPFGNLWGDEKTLYLFIIHLDLKLLGNNVSFIARWPGSWCISTQPPCLLAENAPFLNACVSNSLSAFSAAGTGSSWMSPKQARCLHQIQMKAWTTRKS